MKTLKTSLLIAAIVVASTNIYSQSNKKKNNSSPVESGGSMCFNENSHILNLGIGFGGGNYYSGYYGFGYNYKVSPAFSLSYEQAIPKKLGPGFLGLGAYFGYQTSSSTYNYFWDKHGYNNNYYYKNSWTNFMIAARGAYHLDILNSEKAELYFGLVAGLRIQSYISDSNNPDPYADNYRLSSGNVYPAYSLFIGGRYYFTPNIGLFAELGYGISYFTGGISIKF